MPGESSSTVDYACVSGQDFYFIPSFAVWGLQTLVVAAVLCVALALGFVVWRRVQV